MWITFRLKCVPTIYVINSVSDPLSIISVSGVIAIQWCYICNPHVGNPPAQAIETLGHEASGCPGEWAIPRSRDSLHLWEMQDCSKCILACACKVKGNCLRKMQKSRCLSICVHEVRVKPQHLTTGRLECTSYTQLTWTRNSGIVLLFPRSILTWHLPPSSLLLLPRRGS